MEDVIFDKLGNVVFWVIFSVVLYILIKKSVTTVPEGTVRLVQRLGKYHRMFRPGLNFMIPFIEEPKIPVINTYSRDLEIEEKKTSDLSNMNRSKLTSLVDQKGNITTTEVILDPPEIIVIS